MTETVFFDYWRSSAAYRVRIALNLKGIVRQTVHIDLRAGDQRDPSYLARNPQGLVPVLEIDGLGLTQSLAIIAYLDDTRTEPPLMPADAAGRARVAALAHAIAMDIHPICNLSVERHVGELANWGEEGQRAWMHRFIGRGLAAFESLLAHEATGVFCHGDRPSLADCCLIPQLYNARRWEVPLERLPRILEVEASCRDVEAFADAHPDRVRPAGG